MEDHHTHGVELNTTRVFFVVGATGVGKSELALELAERRHAAILCLDSMQIYRGLHIGTGQPTTAEQARVPHGGLNLIEPGQPYSVAQYVEQARTFFTEHERIVVVGGTGLYYRALTQGLCEAPSSDAARQQTLEQSSLMDLQSRLRELDPVMWARVDQQNPRRLIRAIQVMEETGVSLAEWQQQPTEPVVKDFATVWVTREAEEHRSRIAKRVEMMFAQGWVEEVHGLIERYGMDVLRETKAIGYALIASALAEGRDPREHQEEIVTNTWQYARRQLTWFRREPLMRELKLSDSFHAMGSLEALVSLLELP